MKIIILLIVTLVQSTFTICNSIDKNTDDLSDTSKCEKEYANYNSNSVKKK